MISEATGGVKWNARVIKKKSTGSTELHLIVTLLDTPRKRK